MLLPAPPPPPPPPAIQRQRRRLAACVRPGPPAQAGTARAGLATSVDGVEWRRGGGAVAGRAGAEEVGRVMGPNTEDWWTLDTAHLAVSDVQVLRSPNSVHTTAVDEACHGGT